MSQFSPHFQSEEFYRPDDPIPEECLPIFKTLCGEVLEPIRMKYGIVYITSGYRSPAHNAQVGGAKNSDHIATPEHCAADFQIPGADLVDVFDWIRLESRLPIDQVILEYGSSGDDAVPGCIHVSYSTTPRYEALIGMTHGQSGYEAANYNAPTDVSA